MVLLKKFIDLLLYSNAWIAFSAVAMALQTEWILFRRLTWSPLWGFIFCGTLFLYALHRLVGIDKVKDYEDQGRLGIIKDRQVDIALYAGVSALAAAWFLWRCGPRIWVWVILPALVSLAYVIPVFRGGRRVRDFNYIKIFMVAGAWAFITVALPAVRHHWLLTVPVILMILERSLFVFAITLPFDIRDTELDAMNQVKTLPQRLGHPGTRWLGALLLALMLFLVGLNYRMDTYNLGIALALATTALLAFILLWVARKGMHDYFFTGLVDGLMIVQFGLVWWWSAFG